MRLTMKTYTDAGQLPFARSDGHLPGFGERSDSRIDSRTLGQTGQSVSQPVIEKRELKSKNSLENTGESHGDSQLVTTSHEKSKWRREGDSNPQNSADNNGNPHNDSQRDSQFPVASSPDLSQVVTSWANFPPTQVRHSRHCQIGGMIFTMSFNLTWHMSAAKSNLTRLQAGDLAGRIGRSPLWKNVLAGWEPARRRFGHETDKPKRG